MKDFKNDSDTTLARFGRDKRARISSAERIERRPRLQRDAADSGKIIPEGTRICIAMKSLVHLMMSE